MLYLLLICAGIFIFGYLLYGTFLSRHFELNDAQLTPAHALQDNVDYVPTHPLVVLGHHFSSIAGAGPIVGPIIAAQEFGWLPALLWIVLGSLFIGGVHDFSAMVASIRHEGKSIPEICKRYMNPTAYRLFLGFIWLTLVYIIIAFADLTAEAFVEDGSVATASSIYIGLAILFGLATRRLGMGLATATVIVVLLVLAAIGVGYYYPLSAAKLAASLGLQEKQCWYLGLMLYAFIASITPVWILLQPRDYISSYLLYLSILSAVLGLLFGGFHIQYPSFLAWETANTGALFPFLFITVACGACSGFHSIVASGTTSKQLFRESDALKVGYGGMLIEGLVAIVALGTIMILAYDPSLAKLKPLEIYARGISRFLEVLGIPAAVGKTFGYLAISTFILTTLDTATRIGRYAFQEFFSLSNRAFARYFSTLITIALPVTFIFLKAHNAQGEVISAYKLIWPVFGATNQLLAGLALLAIVVWLRVQKKRYSMILLPALFMLITTLTALVSLLLKGQTPLITIIAVILIVLATLLVLQTIIVFCKPIPTKKS